MGVSASKVREEVLDAYRPLVGLVAVRKGLHPASHCVQAANKLQRGAPAAE